MWSSMKPTIGRIVIYKLDPAGGRVDVFPNNHALECPAIIVRAWEDGKVNLKLFPDGREDGEWRTSVAEGTDPGT